MGKPRSPWGTCRVCKGKVQWIELKLTPEQERENEAVEKINEDLREKMRAERQARFDKGDYGWYESEFKLEELPHMWPSSKPRWTHGPEEPGTDNVFCPDEFQDPSVRLWQRKKAQPKEYCLERTNADEVCNRTANFEDDNGNFYCKQHYEPVKAKEEGQWLRTRRNSQRQWAEAVLAERKKEILSYGLKEEQAEFSVDYRDNMTCSFDVDVLIDFLERITAHAQGRRPSRTA